MSTVTPSRPPPQTSPHLPVIPGRHAGKTALVTGGARGIGAGIVERLAAEGADVTFTYASATAEADALVQRILSNGGAATAVAADSSDRERIRQVVSQTIAHTRHLDIVVSNAGGGTLRPVADLTDDEIDRMIDVNIRGTLDTVRFGLPHLPRGGRVLTIGSVTAHHFPTDDSALYGLTKGAVASLVRGMARELGPRGVTINNVQPGPVDTPANPADGPAGDLLRASIPVGRFGSVHEVAALVSYLASNEGAYINGASFDIDGGYSA